MAIGGWKYCGFITNPHSGSFTDVGLEVTEWKTALVALLSAGSTGWSLHADVAQYNDGCFWFAIEHTGGARFVFARCGTNSTGNVVEASNSYDAISKAAGTYSNNYWGAYVQPHLSATALGTNPATAGFLPTGSLKFVSWRGYDDTNLTGYPVAHHIFVRGGGIIWGVSYDVSTNPEVGYLGLAGECLDRLAHEDHDTEPDNHADSKYAQLVWAGCNYTAQLRAQFFKADQTLYVVATANQAYLSELLTDNVCDREPWTWQVPTFYISSNDLDNDGVVTGDGIKGSMNPEWFRYTMFPGGPANDKQRLEGGAFIYLRNGIAVGYDSGNGSML